MYTPESGGNPEKFLEEQLQICTEFINSRLADATPWESKGYGEGVIVEVKEAPLLRLTNGSAIFCSSRTTIRGEEPDELTISVHHGSFQGTLGIRNDGMFDYAADQDAKDLYEEYDIPRTQAFQDTNFIKLLALTSRMITEEVPKPPRQYTPRPLPRSIIVSALEAERTSRLDIGVAEQQLHGQDAALVDDSNNLFGVFDGVGSEEDSAFAARLAASSIQASMATRSKETNPNSVRAALVEALSEAHLDITAWREQTHKQGCTTAAVGKIVEGKSYDYLVWASVGDSRLYLKHPWGSLVQVSQDEGEGRYLANSLGHAFRGVNEHGILKLDKGSEIILVTDGITGDYDTDILSNQEILIALKNSPSALSAASRLIAISRKHDDKMAIVVRY